MAVSAVTYSKYCRRTQQAVRHSKSASAVGLVENLLWSKLVLALLPDESLLEQIQCQPCIFFSQDQTCLSPVSLMSYLSLVYRC